MPENEANKFYFTFTAHVCVCVCRAAEARHRISLTRRRYEMYKVRRHGGCNGMQSLYNYVWTTFHQLDYTLGYVSISKVGISTREYKDITHTLFVYKLSGHGMLLWATLLESSPPLHCCLPIFNPPSTHIHMFTYIHTCTHILYTSLKDTLHFGNIATSLCCKQSFAKPEWPERNSRNFERPEQNSRNFSEMNICTNPAFFVSKSSGSLKKAFQLSKKPSGL